MSIIRCQCSFPAGDDRPLAGRSMRARDAGRPARPRRIRPRGPKAILVAGLLASSIGSAVAHSPGEGETAWQWVFEPWVVACLASSLVLYVVGVARLWRRAGSGRGIGVAHVGAFAAGWLAVVLALCSPLDPLGEQAFSAHMLQHEVLMLIAAPLLVVARPLAAWAWALPVRARPAVGGALRNRGWRRLWGAIRSPTGAWLLHAAALWGWHAPVLFSLALRDPDVHTLQHASFLGTALLFWWTVLGTSARTRLGAALLSLFATMVHSTVLGALITLSPRLWYPAYASTASPFGVDPLADQQLGGLLMWVPGGLVYMVVGLWLARRWLIDVPAHRVGAA